MDNVNKSEINFPGINPYVIIHLDSQQYETVTREVKRQDYRHLIKLPLYEEDVQTLKGKFLQHLEAPEIAYCLN